MSVASGVPSSAMRRSRAATSATSITARRSRATSTPATVMTRVFDSTPLSMTNGRFSAAARTARTPSDAAQAAMNASQIQMRAARFCATNASTAFVAPACDASRPIVPTRSLKGIVANRKSSP